MFGSCMYTYSYGGEGMGMRLVAAAEVFDAHWISSEEYINSTISILESENLVVSTVHELCAVLGLDFLSIVTEVHPSLDEANGVQTQSISNETHARLAKTVLTLKDDKKQRLKKLKDLATQLIDLWNLMDTPDEAEGKASELKKHVDKMMGDSNIAHTSLLPQRIVNDLKAYNVKLGIVNLHAPT